MTDRLDLIEGKPRPALGVAPEPEPQHAPLDGHRTVRQRLHVDRVVLANRHVKPLRDVMQEIEILVAQDFRGMKQHLADRGIEVAFQ